jgi:hypothetical protein
LTARANTRQRRAAIKKRAAPTIEQLLEQLPLEKRIAYAICRTYYRECACWRAPHKPACERMEGGARHIIDTVRLHDRKAAEERKEVMPIATA